MSLANKNEYYKIEVNPIPNSINSFSLSSNGEYLAVQMFYTNIGGLLAVINVSNGEITIINDVLKSNSKLVEGTQAYNWSPTGNKLAISYGNTERSELSVYDMNSKSLSDIPYEERLYNTLFVLWSNDGKLIDFVSEYPSDEFKLYRVNIADNKTVYLSKVTRDDFPICTKIY